MNCVSKVSLGILKKSYMVELKNMNGKLFSIRCFFLGGRKFQKQDFKMQCLTSAGIFVENKIGLKILAYSSQLILPFKLLQSNNVNSSYDLSSYIF